LDILAAILRGGGDKAREAGLLIAGGHTIDDREPKYGLAVTGLVRPGSQVTNSGAKPGDRLFLTKPLGIGVITTAIKAGVASPAVVAEAIGVMTTLNRAASEAMVEVGVSACTDITGYGLLGHALEMARGSGVRITFRSSQVPVLPAARDLAGLGVVPGGTFRNMTFLEGQVQWDSDIDELQRTLLADAQTSGGLLIAVAPGKAELLEAALRRRGVATIAEIGGCGEAGELPLQVIQ
ncbi:MAG: selenide, water dikinase SelD, partial [Chloroflexota bacterium]